MNNDLQAFLRSRRSIRHFKPDLVPAETIQRILVTTIYAPSAHNLQPWRFVVLTSEIAKSRLTQAITAKFKQDMKSDSIPEFEIQKRVAQTIQYARTAPVIIVLCRDRQSVKPQPDATRKQAEALMAVQSVAMAGLQLLLAAHAEGLGGCWICWPLFAPEETRRSLGLTSSLEPEGMVFIGQPDETRETPARISVQEVTSYL